MTPKKRPPPAKRTARSPLPKPRRGWKATHISQQRVFQETFVYLMWNFPFLFLNKFGISDHTVARRKNVSETTPGWVNTILSFNLAFGLEVEQFVHRLYKLQNVHFLTGSGRTEWFVVFSPIVGFSVLYMNWRFGWHLTWKQLAVAFFMPGIWWDGLLWLIFFRALKLLCIMFAVIFIVWGIAHMK